MAMMTNGRLKSRDREKGKGWQGFETKMKSEGFADLHQHVLWGLDDGPQTSEQMRVLLRQDVEEGIQLVFATAHAYPKLRAFDLAR